MKLTIINRQPQVPLVAGSTSGGGGTSSVTWGGISLTTVEHTKKTVTVQGTPDPPPAIALPTAQSGILVPYMIGTQRVMQPNVIWYGNLKPRIENRKEVTNVEQEEFRTVGGGQVEREIVTTETVTEVAQIVGYTVDMQLGLALGPGAKLRKLYYNDTLVWTGNIGPLRTAFTLPNPSPFFKNDLFFSGGNFDQAPDPYLDPLIAAGLPGYVGITTLVLKEAEVTGGFGQLSPEIERFPNPLGLAPDVNRIGDDINIATALIDFLTTTWGGTGVNISKFNTASFVAAALVLAEEQNGCSLYVQQETTGKSIIDTLQSQARGIMYEDPSTGLINFRLLREKLLDFENLPLLDESNVKFIKNLSKPTWTGLPNQMRVTFTDRTGNYSESVAIAQNLAVLSTAGRARRTATAVYPACYVKELAAALCARDLSAMSVPSMSLEVQMDRDGASFLPGDAVNLTWADYELDKVAFYVEKRKEHPKSSNQVTLLLSQVSLAKSNVLFTPPEDSLFDPVDTSAHTPIDLWIKTAPYWLMAKAGYKSSPTFNIPEVYPMLFAEAYSTSQTGFDIYINNIPTLGQAQTRTSAPYSTVGQLTANISQYQDIADGIIDNITITSVNNPLHLYDIGNAGVRTGRLLAFINDEIFSFESVTSLGAGQYRLNNVHRALIDTAPMAHTAGDDVLIVSNIYTFISNSKHLAASDYTPQWALVSRSLTQVGQLSDALIDNSWTPSVRPGSPNRPHNAKIAGNARSATPLAITRGSNYNITWASRSRKNTSTIALQLDAAEQLETVNNVIQKHRVMIRDSANVERSCGVTTGSGDDNALTVTIPLAAAAGAARLWVQAETVYGTSLYRDYLPITLS